MSVMNAAPAIFLAILAVPTTSQVSVEAAFVPSAKPGTDAAIAVTIEPQEAGIVVNEKPAPRLSLDPLQTVLLDKQPPRATGSGEIDPSQAKHLDPSVPVRFAVAIAPGAPRGAHTVRGTVTFFYCSKTEGWCKKGSNEIAVIVPVQ